MIVVNAMPGKMLRLRGALGPLQAMAVDRTMMLPNGRTTRLDVSYAIGGYSKAGFSDLARAVDRVLGEQITRLKSFTETGSVPARPQQTKE